MGLDGVELIMEIEETFQIQITDNEAQTARTVGDLFSIILAKSPEFQLAKSPDFHIESESLFQAALSRVRASLADCLSVAETSLGPQTRLAEVIPPAQLGAVWRQLELSLGYPLPAIRKDPAFDGWARRAVWWLVGSVVGAIALASFNLTLAALAGLSALYALILIIGCMFADVLEAPEFYPENVGTLGDLAKAVSWHYVPEVSGQESPAADHQNSQAWSRLVAIIGKQLGEDPEQMHWHTDLVRDLGL